jgi:hypothetical protein
MGQKWGWKTPNAMQAARPQQLPAFSHRCHHGGAGKGIIFQNWFIAQWR